MFWKILSHTYVICPEFSLVLLKSIFSENAKGHMCAQSFVIWGLPGLGLITAILSKSDELAEGKQILCIFLSENISSMYYPACLNWVYRELNKKLVSSKVEKQNPCLGCFSSSYFPILSMFLEKSCPTTVERLQKADTKHCL